MILLCLYTGVLGTVRFTQLITDYLWHRELPALLLVLMLLLLLLLLSSSSSSLILFPRRFLKRCIAHTTATVRSCSIYSLCVRMSPRVQCYVFVAVRACVRARVCVCKERDEFNISFYAFILAIFQIILRINRVHNIFVIVIDNKHIEIQYGKYTRNLRQTDKQTNNRPWALRSSLCTDHWPEHCHRRLCTNTA